MGQAIVANLRDHKVAISPDGLQEGWSVARRRGQWEVTFRYSLRGQDKQAQFAYDPEGGVTAMNADAAAIGWRPPAAKRAGGADGAPEDESPEAAEVPAEAVAAAKPRVKPKPASRGGAPAATAALWGATKVSPPTAPARRSTFTGAGQGVQGTRPSEEKGPREGSSPDEKRVRGRGSPEARAGAPVAPSKPAARAGAKAPARPEPPRSAGRPRLAPQAPPAKRPPGAADDRPLVARSSPSPRPKRLITVADDEADWASALAKTRAKRKAAAPGPQAGAPVPKPAPKPSPQAPAPPARPRRKRLPDNWLTGE